MFLKLSAPTLLFFGFISFSYFGFSNSLRDTVLDDDFYQDLALFSRFDNKSIKHKNKIENDTLDARGYFFNNSFNLLWKSKTDTDKKKEVTGDAFLLNILLPDWVHEYSPERRNYSPRSYYEGDDVVFLLGTSFSFVSKLFDKVSNWKNEVNDSTSTVKLNDKSNNSNDHEFYFSHPWPTYSTTNQQFQQSHLYQLKNYQNSYVQMNKPFHFKIDNKNVEAVYAAVDLSVNDKLLQIDFSSRNKLQNSLLYIQQEDNSKINWKEEVEDVYGRKYKLAVDFAVLKVKFNISHLNKEFLDYITRLYQKTERIPQILSSEIEITNERTAPVYMGGWEPMPENEIDFHTMDNLFVKPIIKSDKSSEIAAKSSSEYANESKFNECCELKIYEMYGSKTEEASEYEITNKVYYPNVADGILSVEYQIKKKSSDTISKKKSVLIPGFKKQSTNNSELIDIVDNALKKAYQADMDLIDFLEAKPRAHAVWKEYEIKHSYFPFKSIQQNLFEKTLISSNSVGLNLSEPTEIFELNSEKYINMAHHLEIPNMVKNSKGNIAVMKHPYKSEKVMIGIYDGTSSWVNPISTKTRQVGKITIFISPWSYDLFNEKNNLSKPSLGDVLVKKNLHSRMVQTNRFRINSAIQELN